MHGLSVSFNCISLIKAAHSGFSCPSLAAIKMKFVLGILFLLVILCQCGQTISHDPEIIEFIESKGEYCKLTNQEKLPDNIKKHYSTVIEFMESHDMEVENYFVWNEYIEENDSILKIPICHYDGFVREYEIEKKINENNKNDTTETNDGSYTFHSEIKGNSSGGKDGNLILIKKEDRIDQFLIWR